MDVKILVCKFIWDDGMGSVSDALECLRLCKEAGATISSNSWGGVPNSRESWGCARGGPEHGTVLLQGHYGLVARCREVLTAWPHTSSHAQLWCPLPSCFPHPASPSCIPILRPAHSPSNPPSLPSPPAHLQA